ncbi:MAG: hypothetical protein ABF586_03315 [Sporolactobacillus sp.]
MKAGAPQDVLKISDRQTKPHIPSTRGQSSALSREYSKWMAPLKADRTSSPQQIIFILMTALIFVNKAFDLITNTAVNKALRTFIKTFGLKKMSPFTPFGTHMPSYRFTVGTQ